jgi:hypothetical protein
MHNAKGAAETVTVLAAPVENLDGSHSGRNGLLCAFVVAACVLIANPVANMPFSDGFSYDKTALDFARTGHIFYNGWATAMLGWLIPWGALFIKVFGFSFTVMRLSMLPIAMATVYLFHRILRRFGIHPANAVFGALALALSPIFLPSAASFMTDIPGLLVIFLCVYMCQRGVAASSGRAALLWLIAATVVNVAGGTVRQIAWLGALIMVPSTAWLLRERRGMKLAGVLLWIFSFAGILACLHWFSKQPYSVPEHIIWAPIRPITLAHLAAQVVKAFLCLLLVLLPVSAAWLPTARRLNRNAWLRFAGAMTLVCLFAVLAYATHRIDTWLMPWLMFLLPEQSSLVPGMFGTPAAMTLWVRFVISLIVIAAAVIMLEQLIVPTKVKPTGRNGRALSWHQLVWITGPFSCSYFLLLWPRAAFDLIQDRYLIGLTPFAIVFLLRLYQERVRPNLPAVSVAVLGLFAVYSVAGTHDFFAESRAQVRALRMVESSGAPRTSIQAGFPSDGWIQIQNGGHINESRIVVPAGAYRRNLPNLKIPKGCRDGFTKFAPIIVPRYFVLFPWFKNPLDPPPAWCFEHANFLPVRYTTWLPPFHQAIYVQKLKNEPH